MPNRAISGVTPSKAWSESKPNIGHVKVFDCLAYIKLPFIQIRKLSDRSKVVINLGKEPGMKAYRLYDPESKMVHVSRDVVFEEGKAWNWEKMEANKGEHRDTFIVSNLHTGVVINELEGKVNTLRRLNILGQVRVGMNQLKHPITLL